jgi:2,3,4,5-tetrahydropyridine-2-carboxylate N-succinyltransferase
LQAEIEKLFDEKPETYTEDHFRLFQEFKAALNAGTIRAAEPDSKTSIGWRVNGWVKKGILLGFRMGAVVDMSIDPTRQPFFDKGTYPVKRLTAHSGVRIVPGGSSIRDGCYVGRGVTCMPPMFINAGSYVGDGTMIDSHALVGSCAQVGRNCHISAGSQIGGVLEPVGALPVVIEDDVLVGGNCGIYEGTVVKRRPVRRWWRRPARCWWWRPRRRWMWLQRPGRRCLRRPAMSYFWDGEMSYVWYRE